MSEAVKIWAETLQDVLRNCLPHELRVQVLSALLERERACKPFRIIGMDELMAMKFAPYRPKKEALALVVQIMVRSIVNNYSPRDRGRDPVSRSLRLQHRLGLALRLFERPAGACGRPEGMRRDLRCSRAGPAARGRDGNATRVFPNGT